MDPNDQKKTACYDIDVEVDDTLKTQMNSFLLSTASQQEIAGLDNKVCKFHIWPKASKVTCLFWLDKQSSKCSAHHCRGELCLCLCSDVLLHILCLSAAYQSGSWQHASLNVFKLFCCGQKPGRGPGKSASCFLLALDMFHLILLCLLIIFSSLVTTSGIATRLAVDTLLPQLLHA